MTEPDREKQQEGIDIEESQGMGSAEQELFLNVRRSRSDQSFLGKLITISKSEIEKRPLILNIHNDPDEPNNNNTGFKVFRKIKKERKKNQSDYTKNICGYITKKIIREFVSSNYYPYVAELCQKYKCDYKTMKSYYLSKIQRITGPSHIPGLLAPEKEEEVTIKNVFREFFEWFLKERYLRYLLNEGKMADKKAYIEYKNNVLMGLLREAKDGKPDFSLNGLKQQQHSSSSMEEESPIAKSEQSEIEACQKPEKESEKQVEARQEPQPPKRQKLIPRIPIVKKDLGTSFINQ